METGGVAPLARISASSSLTCFPFGRVSFGSYLPLPLRSCQLLVRLLLFALLLYAHRPFMLQVFICLNMNGTASLLCWLFAKHVDWVQLCSKFQTHLTWYVSVCYEWRKFPTSFTTQMFQVPSLIAMSIAATRMHRSLIDFGSSDKYHLLTLLLPAFCC